MITIEKCSEYNVRIMKTPDFKNKIHGYNFAYPVMNSIDICNLFISGGDTEISMNGKSKSTFSFNVDSNILTITEKNQKKLYTIDNPAELGETMVKYFEEHQSEILQKTLETNMKKTCLDYYKTLGDEFYEQLCSMLVFDALIYNEDRHFGNLGLLRNNHTGEIIAPAPIFDNGLSLFNYAMPDDFKNLSVYAKTRSNPYRISYEDVCKEVMGVKQKAQLRRMVDFKFTRHPSLNLPEERLSAIEKQLGERTRELLSIPVQRSTKRKNEPER